MSLKTWKKEFYPVPASKGEKMSDIEAIEASLLKWRGLTKTNTKKHNVEYEEHYLTCENGRDFDSLPIDGESCHLCDKHYATHAAYECATCPIYKVTGSSCGAAYRNSLNSPTSMIKLLEKTLKATKDNVTTTESTGEVVWIICTEGTIDAYDSYQAEVLAVSAMAKPSKKELIRTFPHLKNIPYTVTRADVFQLKVQ